MDKFRIARFRLTGWYILIVLLVAGIFSLLIFQDLVNELSRGYLAIERSIETQPPSPGRALFLARLAEELDNAKQIVMARLIVINAFVITTSGIAAYFLAGKSLRPIEESVKRQKQFIADASHELKTPLTIMRSEIDVALRQKLISSKEAKEILESNLDEVIKMQNLTNYLLVLGKHDDANRKIKKTQFNLKTLIEQVAKRYQKELITKNLKLEINAQNIIFFGEQESIRELLTILVDNAIKYSLKGTIKIVTKDHKKSINILVSDEGIGINPTDIENIFNRFYQADSSRHKSEVAGYGLGLSIAKSIVDSHKGEISVKSKLGKGSTFIVTLPKI